MPRQQLPPQIKKIEVRDRTTGRMVTRYQVTTDAGIDQITGKRRQIRRRFESEKKAREALSQSNTEAIRGTFVARSQTTLAEAAELHFAGRHRLRETTLGGYREVMKPVLACHGNLPVQKLSKRHIDQLVVGLQQGGLPKPNGQLTRPWGPRSINLMLTVLSMILDGEFKQGHVQRNVARLVDRVPRDAKELKTFTTSEVRTLLSTVSGDRNEHAWRLALSGLRRGEVCGLRWKDVDLRDGFLTIGNNRVLTVSGEIVEQEPKTKKSSRTLPLTKDLELALRCAKDCQAAERRLHGEEYGPGTHVVSDELGYPVRPDVLAARWERLTKIAGVSEIRFHDARHTCATLMHLAGVPIAVIAAWLGHADASFTMRTYVHSQSNALTDAATQYAALFNRPPDSNQPT
ncbi:site-specific integrase [Rhodococcus sp. 06-156-3C]|uniref:site-specific integrase n=1 Tax=Nocardiaceae TaxID=85025 RepID=UPI000522E7F5|nr:MULTISPECIES: site-specific integrase [Rhodococcus]OZD12997.1 site-specific integrase [Rhodococcus sp. 06-156-4a]OZD17865.1 site-specific integrase [Rhodococcus sp. 06-156-3C]OZD20591.1 site-specific integrase [Rhodococcus sp. 06-156-4C]OZD30690.1 site-specific integrase [Rhodococcus sp. 06-156-3b]OZD32535.1 site-specific integrase [Rhodococcus sp. 06-156-3]